MGSTQQTEGAGDEGFILPALSPGTSAGQRRTSTAPACPHRHHRTLSGPLFPSGRRPPSTENLVLPTRPAARRCPASAISYNLQLLQACQKTTDVHRGSRTQFWRRTASDLTGLPDEGMSASSPRTGARRRPLGQRPLMPRSVTVSGTISGTVRRGRSLSN